MLEAALCAPNHKLTKPWRFTVLRGDARARLGQVWSQTLARRTEQRNDDYEGLLAREAQKPLRAPVIIVASTRTVDDAVTSREDLTATAAAVQNLLLAAHALGLGAIWRTGEMAYSREIVEHLGLNTTDRIVAFVYVGRPAIAAPKSLPRDLQPYVRYLD